MMWHECELIIHYSVELLKRANWDDIQQTVHRGRSGGQNWQLTHLFQVSDMFCVLALCALQTKQKQEAENELSALKFNVEIYKVLGKLLKT